MQVPPETRTGRLGKGSPSQSQTNFNAHHIAENSESRQAPSALELQIAALTRRFALREATACTIASLAFAGGGR